MFLKAKKFLVDNKNEKYFLNKEKNISIIKMNDKYLIETNEKKYEILIKPKNIIFGNNRLICLSFILNKSKHLKLLKI